MAEWNLRYEKEIKIPDKEKNYFLKTINDFTELNQDERKILERILKNEKGKTCQI